MVEKIMRPILPKILLLTLTLGTLFLLFTKAISQAAPTPSSPLNAPDYALCHQPPLMSPITTSLDLDYQVYLPLISDGSPPRPLCTVYCGLMVEDDPYRPSGYQTYFADEFNCNQLLPYWTVQSQMTVASYSPPATGYVKVDQGTLKIGVPGADTSFPYLYLVDDTATTYDVSHTSGTGDWVPRVDWLPDEGNFRIAMRVRFNVDALGEHRIAIYADGHRPTYAGPLFYIGSDYNAQEEAWRGLIIGADRGTNFVDLGDYGYADPYPDWVVVTIDFNDTADTFTMSVDGLPYIMKPLSSFKDYPHSATRPDTLYLGSLALLRHATTWTDIELDWLRVYAPASTPQAPFGLIAATIEATPVPTDTPTTYSAALPPGPFANTPHWSEDFNQPETLDYWHLIQIPDPLNSWTEIINSQVALRNNGNAIGVPVWAIFDDMLPIDILSSLEQERETPEDYLQTRGGSPFYPPSGNLAATEVYTRTDWRPNNGNIRYAWRGEQTANGYGVEISNSGHFPYFTGAMFYTLQDTSSNGGQGQFIFPGCQEQYFWRLHRLPGYSVPHNEWMTITADYVNGTVHLYVDGQKVGWWPKSDCSLNWYLKGENATAPDVLFFGNPATAPFAPGGWSEIFIDWFVTFPGLPRVPPL
jgi:hypothetical protein